MRSETEEAAIADGERDLTADFDPLTLTTLEDIYSSFAGLRRERPMARSDAYGGFWSVVRHADVAEVASCPHLFTSTQQNAVPRLSPTGRKAPLALDPPEHTPYRRAIVQALSARRVAQLEVGARAHSRRLLEALVDRGEGDIVAEFASLLPVIVFSDWMGLDADQTEILWTVGKDYVRARQRSDLSLNDDTMRRMVAMAQDLIADRRANPRDPQQDPTSSLLAEREGGALLDPDLVAASVRQILIVGIVAPPLVFGSISLHLARDPALHRFLQGNPGSIPSAIEEFLRLYTPYRGFARTASADIEVHGRQLLAREPVALAFASANRDEAVFPDSGTFILDRPNIRQHIAFGVGAHACPGLSVARLELRVMLEELLRVTDRIELIGPVHLANMPELGPTSVPLRFMKASA